MLNDAQKEHDFQQTSHLVFSDQATRKLTCSLKLVGAFGKVTFLILKAGNKISNTLLFEKFSLKILQVDKNNSKRILTNLQTGAVCIGVS